MACFASLLASLQTFHVCDCIVSRHLIGQTLLSADATAVSVPGKVVNGMWLAMMDAALSADSEPAKVAAYLY
jgi:hypothetical protein